MQSTDNKKRKHKELSRQTHNDLSEFDEVEEVEEVKKSSELDAANTRAQGLNANREAVIGTP